MNASRAVLGPADDCGAEDLDPEQVADFMNESMEKLRSLGWDAISRDRQIASCISVARFNLEMGGVSTYLYNRDQEGRLRDIDAVREIGARALASVLERANELMHSVDSTEGKSWGQATSHIRDDLANLETQARRSELNDLEDLLLAHLRRAG